MSDKNGLNRAEINEETLDKVDGGFSLNDLLFGKDREPEAKKLPTEGKTFTVQSALATGEEIGPAPTKTDDSITSGKKTGTRIPKIVFADKGHSI